MLGLAGKSLGWFLAGVAVALGFLLVPLQVAAERKKLDHSVAEIARAQRDIQSLETEFDARATYAQLDRWNNDALHMTAPAAGQFVSDEAALASIDVHAPGVDRAAPQMAAFAPLRPAAATPAERAAPGQAVVETAQAAPEPRRHAQAVALLDRAILGDSMIGDLRRGAQAEMGSAR